MVDTSTMIEKFIENLPAIITAIGGVWLVIHPIKKQVEEIQHSTNSMKDALVEATIIKGRIEGAEKEKGQRAIRDADIQTGIDRERATPSKKQQDQNELTSASNSVKVPVPVEIIAPDPIVVTTVSSKDKPK